MTDTVTLRSIAPSVFLPAGVYEIGNGAIAPIIALTALDEGASVRTAGLMLALLGVGQILGDLPAGALADRVGDRRAMILAAAIDIIALCGCFFARSLAVLGPSLVVIGMANATYYLGRQSYLTDLAPVHLRARALSTLGGSHRIGLFIGPFLGAAAIHFTNLRGAYVVAAGAAGLAVLLLLVIPDVPPQAGHPAPVRGETSSFRMLAIHRKLFATLGMAIFLAGATRAARQTVLPLWAQHLGLNPVTTSIIFGIASAVDMAIFYPAGKVMDEFGRLAVAVPSMLVLGSTMAVIPLTQGVLSLGIVAIAMSVGNGIGSGIIMTLGADTAPGQSRARYLAMWRLFSDSGNAAGPFVISIVALVSSLTVGIVTIGCSGFLAAGALAIWVPRYSPFATRRAIRAHRAAHPDG